VPIEKIAVADYLTMYQNCIVMDVRSAGEYSHAHIPAAINLVLFDDAERAKIGTLYKQNSKQRAVKEGLAYFGPKLLPLLKIVEGLQAVEVEKPIVVHCARGGMRSGAVCWLLDLYGYDVKQIVGGYKAYRQWVLQQFTMPYNLQIVGGYTGSAKTEVLHCLQQNNVSIIDLEGLAHHKGSAFGAIGMPTQPSQELFENKLATALFGVANTNANELILLEDESQRIGTNNIPNEFWLNMRRANILFLDIPFAERLQHIVDEYGQLPLDSLIECTERITKNLGGAEAKTALRFLYEKNYTESFTILLAYYDKYYGKGLQKRQDWEKLKINIPCATTNVEANANKIMELIKQ
jgi:tRNA 2-selenouridine synthase